MMMMEERGKGRGSEVEGTMREEKKRERKLSTTQILY